MTMTKEEFIKEMKKEKSEYLNNIEKYFDALIEYDFDKAFKYATKAVLILDPDAQAHLLLKARFTTAYIKLENTYLDKAREADNKLLKRDDGDE